ncbi:MAG: hypothetical protein AB8F78_15735 [Saprospiraceae bacterium]
MSSSNFHIVSNRNNRNLQRTGNRSFKTRKREFLGRDIPRSLKPLRDQYDSTDRTPPVWKRAVVMTLYLSIAAAFIYALCI